MKSDRIEILSVTDSPAHSPQGRVAQRATGIWVDGMDGVNTVCHEFYYDSLYLDGVYDCVHVRCTYVQRPCPVNCATAGPRAGARISTFSRTAAGRPGRLIMSAQPVPSS